MKLLDYIFYKVSKYYQGDANPDFYPIYILTLISLSSISIILNTTELLIGEKLVDLKNNDVLAISIGIFICGFFSVLFYLVYIKFGRNYRISFNESRVGRILGSIGVITLIVVLFLSALLLYSIRFRSFA
ncbi:hypothetical protein [Cytophaga hutchinsonii]|uniref:Uncharacterized protein n=1 Tax=Cytophaga hutchinsonii (strain ATCC 33406 / DSM 1761 / CIP 103989 / NBRC 15051 / NCIMB 9469 / D465) TaxID=269798 RepID=A0A6N4SQI7_CYTH3|nr:hypothetical protein [Cytophaga hutchinsonii]ABG58565.1 hypothetical protein CHU_1293 [Cytophaga hutchinsonii ATCC 33406]SFX77170.1 hypothetical protein SAMN04487930_109132 [Cytophaga hutchinsonii ATCC 33406]